MIQMTYADIDLNVANLVAGEQMAFAWLPSPAHGQAACTNASAVTLPPDAAMIANIVSRVMFC